MTEYLLKTWLAAVLVIELGAVAYIAKLTVCDLLERHWEEGLLGAMVVFVCAPAVAVVTVSLFFPGALP